MDDQQRARELLAQEYERQGGWVADTSEEIRAGILDRQEKAAVAAITAALRAAPEWPSMDDMVAAYVAAVNEHLGKLTPKEWEIERFDPAASIARVARIGLTAALAARPQGVKDA